jgi:NAD(P)H-hydrate repair Nnr-like enzyme with NAD(P)H-hydrate dehydratase domain
VVPLRDSLKYPPNVLAGYAGCLMTRQVNEAAFEKKGRSAIVSDMIEEIGQAFAQSFEKHASSL